MCGAVIVPDLSANQAAIKALKQLIMVHGLTQSVLQCDGHSGLMKLQDQVGKDLSLPTQSVPHILIKARQLSKDFARPCMVRSRQPNSDLLISEFIPIQQQLVSRPGPGSSSMLSSRSPATSFVRVERPHTSGCSTRLIQVLWFILGNEFSAQKPHHWYARYGSFWTDSQNGLNPNRHPFDQGTSFQFCSAKSLFHLTNENLTIKNLKKIALLFRNCSGLSSCNENLTCSNSSCSWISNTSWTSSTASSSCSTARASSASAASPAIRSATRSDQEKNHKEVKAHGINRSSSSHSRHQGESSFHQPGSGQRRSSGSSIRREVAPVPLGSLTVEERRSIIESRWAIGRRPGSELKGRFCAK